jgi:ATP:cob(I)alamin adenosyltransferase
MSKIYTKNGDKGETQIFGGSKISKDDLKVWCYGTVDEMSASLGVARASISDTKVKEIIFVIQNSLITVGAYIASDDISRKLLTNTISQKDIDSFENIIDEYTKAIGNINSFIISGDCIASANLHMSRTIARRAERLLVQLSKQEEIDPIFLKYLNRLSDLLFTLARIKNL